MTAILIPAERLEDMRRERERKRQERQAFVGTILGGILDDEPDDEPERVASEPMGDTAKWLKQILTP